MASEQSSSGPALNDMTPEIISSGLVQKYSSSASYVPPSRNDWDMLFQPMFDELLIPPPSVDNHAAKDAPSPSKSLTPTEIQSSVILQDVGNDNLDIEVAHMGNDPLLDVPIPEVTSKQSSLTASPQSNVQSNHPMTHHNSKWTKDHPLNYIIGPLSRPVSTRLQLHEQALFCYYDAFLTSVEPKTYKEALTQACWIEAMQEELNEFERLEAWELVPRPDKVMEVVPRNYDPKGARFLIASRFPTPPLACEFFNPGVTETLKTKKPKNVSVKFSLSFPFCACALGLNLSRNNSPQREASPAIVEPLRIELPFLEDQFQEDPPPESPMADNRTMAELLQAPTEGYEDAIVIPEITANNFKLKHDLINLVQNKQFFGHDKEDPHAYIRYFNKITSTMKVPN
nr:integrase, catalytic region, zinc finger, CCHC-type, peptidase aspartic, catalytic [Tanacetum cinerariifolium]